MRSPVRVLAGGLVAFALATGASALDYGLTLSNDSMVSSNGDFAINQSNRANAWISRLIGKDTVVHLSGFYEFLGNIQKDGGTVTPARFDLGRTDIEGSIAALLGPQSMLRFSIGRSVFSDFSTRLLTGLSDGARAELSIGGITGTVTGGYRGLLYKQDALSFLDAADQALLDDSEAYFAPKRAFAGLGLSASELFGSWDLGLEGWGQLDLSGRGTVTQSGYVEPWLSGRPSRSLAWRAWGIYELGYDGELFSSMAAGSELDFFLPEFLGFRLSQKLLWASGESGPFRAFTPLRRSALGSVAALPFSDAASASLEAFVTPLRGVYVGLSLAALFRASDNPPSNGSIRADANGSYLGFESNLLASARIGFDLSLSGGIGIFVPNTATMYSADSANRLSATLSATFAL